MYAKVTQSTLIILTTQTVALQLTPQPAGFITVSKHIFKCSVSDCITQIFN